MFFVEHDYFTFPVWYVADNILFQEHGAKERRSAKAKSSRSPMVIGVINVQTYYSAHVQKRAFRVAWATETLLYSRRLAIC